MPRRFDPSPPRTRTKAPPPAVELVPTSSSSSALRLRLRLIKGCNFVAGRTDGRTDAAEQRQTQIHLI